MKVGSLIECVSAFTGEDNFYDDQLPIVKNLYVIRGMEQIYGETGITVEEIINPVRHFVENGRVIYREVSFLIDKFREIQPPMKISIDEFIEELV